MFDWVWRIFGPRINQVQDSASCAAPSFEVDDSNDFWISFEGERLAQGDMLENCLVPSIPADFGVTGESNQQVVDLAQANLVIITQSCDLENNKVDFVSFCQVIRLEQFEEINPDFKKKGKWEEVRLGRREGLYLLPSPEKPNENREALLLDFRQLFSLPIGYVSNHAKRAGRRWRLKSPYLEHFSQAFARFFMRVGLPSAIPPFK